MLTILQQKQDIWRYKRDYMYAKSIYFALLTPNSVQSDNLICDVIPL